MLCLYQIGETHESHSENAGGDERDGHAFHALGDLNQLQLFAETSKDDDGHREAYGDEH